MVKNRFFYIVVAVAVLALAAFVVNQAAATAQVIANTGAETLNSGQALNATCPFTTELLKSLHGGYSQESGQYLIETSSGPTGVEGGLLALLGCR